MNWFKRVCGLISLLALLSTSFIVNAQVAEKKSGFMGDPSRKRGSELGFDYGLKAGRTDFKDGKEANPRDHEEYVNPNPIYRYEYGYRASFNSGFRNGFLSGYKQTYGEEALPTQVTVVPEEKVLDAEVKTPENKPQELTLKTNPNTPSQPTVATTTSSSTKPQVKIREKKESNPTVVDAYSDAL